MGRSHEYQVKNTFVEIQIPPEDQQYGRSQRTLSEAQAGQYEEDSVEERQRRLDDYLAARTPSPFMHPSQDPTELMMQMQPLPGCGYDLAAPGNVPIAFGDLPADFELTGFDNGIDGQDYTNAMAYDPNTGMFIPYDWSMQYNPDCYQMMGGIPVDGAVDEYGNYLNNMPLGGVGTAEQLLAALSEKITAGRDGHPGLPDCPEGAIVLNDTFGDGAGTSPDLMDASAIGVGCDMAEGDWNSMEMQAPQPRSEGGGRKGRNRDRGERGGRGDRYQEMGNGHNNSGEEHYGGSRSQDLRTPEASQQGPVNFTTVMFRNIPNKYTREMLVKQLEVDLKGHFDFVYLPIDFKNQCNVGYAFINFRSIEACEIFMNNFNGQEVRKCLPGLNSRKVTEVTPARVQGFEENVQRLRNSPVMRELAHHPEWMPLIFEPNGVQLHFPAPERPLEPIKPRRRAREEVVAGAGA